MHDRQRNKVPATLLFKIEGGDCAVSADNVAVFRESQYLWPLCPKQLSDSVTESKPLDISIDTRVERALC